MYCEVHYNKIFKLWFEYTWESKGKVGYKLTKAYSTTFFAWFAAKRKGYIFINDKNKPDVLY